MVPSCKGQSNLSGPGLCPALVNIFTSACKGQSGDLSPAAGGCSGNRWEWAYLGEGLGRRVWGRRPAGPQHLSLCAQAKLAVLLLTLVVATLSYLSMEQKLRRGVAPRQPRIPRPQHKVRGYRYLEEDNSDESDAEGESAGGHGDGAEEEALPSGPRLGPEPASFCRRPCPYEQAQEGDGPEEK